MTDSDEVTRRRLLRAGAASAAAVGGVGTVAGLEPTSDARDAEALLESAEQVPCIEVTDETTTVAAGGGPELAAGIRPGSQMYVGYPDGTTAGCTANFVWADGNGDLYIGAAGHCFLPDAVNASRNAKRTSETEDDVYDTSDLTVTVCDDCTRGGANGLLVRGTTIPLGDVAYARQAIPDGSGVGHDFGIVRIPSGAESAVDPSLPQYGGPQSVSDVAVPSGTPVNQYGAGVANGEAFATMGSNGVSEGDLGTPESWFAALRASPGDSGSPLQSTTTDGGLRGDQAAGILTHLTAAGVAGTTIGQCKALVQQDVDLDLSVVLP